MIYMETDRLILRNVMRSDAEIMFDYRNNSVCARYQRDQTKDLEGIRKLIERREKDSVSTLTPFLIAVALKDTNEMVGEIVVMPSEDTFSMGYTFSYKHHRKGYAYESLTACIHALHTAYANWEFISFVDPENLASRGLLNKLGYEDLGYLPSRTSQVYGKWITDATRKEIASITKGI